MDLSPHPVQRRRIDAPDASRPQESFDAQGEPDSPPISLGKRQASATLDLSPHPAQRRRVAQESFDVQEEPKPEEFFDARELPATPTGSPVRNQLSLNARTDMTCRKKIMSTAGTRDKKEIPEVRRFTLAEGFQRSYRLQNASTLIDAIQELAVATMYLAGQITPTLKENADPRDNKEIPEVSFATMLVYMASHDPTSCRRPRL